MSVAERLPSGIVTFAFTDIDGSTRLVRRLGDQYADVLERHFDCMHPAWEAHDGHEIGSAGDSTFVAFETPGHAAQACAEAQRLLAAEEWPAEGDVRVRMGVHSGLASPRDGNYQALAVHQAVRVMSAAHGGQVVMSGETHALLGPLDDLEAIRLGRFRLRDFDGPVELFGLSGPGLASEFPAVRGLPAEVHNLVAPATPFFGRDATSAEVDALLQPGRLVTLTGPGGVGKTRLATELGREVVPRWPAGVWMVDLARIQDPSLIPSAVGAAVGAPSGGVDRWKDVLDHLRERQALLLFDNCEALTEACAVAIDELLTRCPTAGVMATSREPLRLRRESVVRVLPLELPNAELQSVDEALGSAAVQMFLDRASTVRRDLSLDDSSVRTIVEICRRLDGLPLALELAAARLSALQPSEVLDGLNDRFQLLRSRSPTLPERQRTLEALLDWSERLLTADERICLRRLSVFGGSFSVAHATVAVADDGVRAYDVPELVWSLVDKSLVVADLSANETRYRLLESVREFGARRLARADEPATVAVRLAAWYLERIGPTQRQLRGWTGETGVELDNLRAIVPLVAVTAPEHAQQLAFVIARYLDAVESYKEGIEELTGYVDELVQPTSTRISLLTTLADLYLRLGDVASASRVMSDAEALAADVGDLPPWDDVAIERTRGDIACRSGDNESAVEAAKRVLSGELSPRGRARMCSQLGIASLALGDLDTAWDAFGDELQTYQHLGDRVFEASSHGNLAEVALQRGDTVAAAQHQKACLDIALELGAPVMVAFSLIVAARIAAGRGGADTAVTLHGHADMILETTGIALYSADRRLSDEMLEAARRDLGDTEFADARASGRSLDLPSVASLADRILAETASAGS